MLGKTVTPYEMIERLVSFDTTSRDSNLALIDFVADYLAAHGVESQRVMDDTGRKANLFATLGPAGPGGIVLSGHTDVVPVDDQDWTSDPFTLARRGGRLFGRGTGRHEELLRHRPGAGAGVPGPLRTVVVTGWSPRPVVPSSGG